MYKFFKMHDGLEYGLRLREGFSTLAIAVVRETTLGQSPLHRWEVKAAQGWREMCDRQTSPGGKKARKELLPLSVLLHLRQCRVK